MSNTQQLKDFADFAHQTGRQRRNYSKMNYDLMWSPFMKDVMLNQIIRFSFVVASLNIAYKVE